MTTLEGKSAVLAHVEFAGRIQVGKYGVDVAAFERVALAALEDAILQRRMVVIDEIGKMELASKLFCGVVQQALDSPAIVLATIMERPHPFVDQIKRRADVVVLELTVENRNQLPATLTAMIREELRGNR